MSADRAPQPDKHWLDPANYKEHWASRAEIAMTLLGSANAVCDLGCGAPQTVRRLLKPGVTYLPADLKAWTPDTEICNLDIAQYPDRALAACDVCLLLGVLERLTVNAGEVFRSLRTRIPRLIFSYHPVDESGKRYLDWKNAYSNAEIDRFIAGANWVARPRILLGGGQFLYDLR